MSLLDLVTGGKSSDASAALDQARREIEAIQSPTAAQLQFQIQKLVQAGVYTPEQGKTFMQNPSAFLSEIIPQTGTSAQETAINSLLGAAKEGGLNPDEQAKIAQIIQQLNTSEKGANDAVVQRQAERGALTGGETLAAELGNNQNADVNANTLGLGTAAEGYNALLQELTSAGTLGGTLQGQENTQANTVAAATDAINKFNTAQQQQEENFNVENKNTAQAANTQNLQNIEGTNVANENQHAKEMADTNQTAYEDALQKAAAAAGVSENIASTDTSQGGQMAGLIGGLVGTAGEAATAGMTPAPTYNFASTPVNKAHGGEIHSYLEGGQVDGKAKVPGDSMKNDTVHAMLSPGEIVLPRTIAHNPEPDRVMAFLNRIRKPKTPHPEDVATVLHALGKVRETPNAA